METFHTPERVIPILQLWADLQGVNLSNLREFTKLTELYRASLN